ncbi:hypothetical protein CNECB9_3880002 [Cupriavidus necator]|uniref:Uncharacterized protein n=1 Tax=Cupriavidus necator TaxID=106590 RepID=A0A1K0IWE9_CUPNE|nr:hypothetical protein CNECB9_3880002 [Cupriavidus necator]
MHLQQSPQAPCSTTDSALGNFWPRRVCTNAPYLAPYHSAVFAPKAIPRMSERAAAALALARDYRMLDPRGHALTGSVPGDRGGAGASAAVGRRLIRHGKPGGKEP